MEVHGAGRRGKDYGIDGSDWSWVGNGDIRSNASEGVVGMLHLMNLRLSL